MREIAIILPVILLLASASVVGQPTVQEDGRPYYLERFTAAETGQHGQNWNIVEDAQGRLFVANRTGVLEFDGQTWRAHSVPNRFVRSLVVGPDGAICVGGVGEVGCLRPDSLGVLRYESLVHHIPAAHRSFTDVWTSHTIGDDVYFQTFGAVFRWDGESMQFWPAEGRFHKAFVVHDRYFVRDEGVGLLELRDGRMQMLEQGHLFADERIDAMFGSSDSDVILATRTRGLLRWDGERLSPHSPEVDALLQGDRIYHGIALTATSFALGTVGGRVVIGRADGSISAVLGSNVGLAPDEMVLDLHYDQQRGLWLALDTGIMRIDIEPSLTLFDQTLGLEGVVYGLTRVEGLQHVATSQGIYRLEPARTVQGQARFTRVSGLRQQVWSVLATDDVLLAAANDGIYEIADGRESRISLEQAFAMRRSRAHQNRVYLGLKDGVGILARRDGAWAMERVVGAGQIGEVRSIYERGADEVWVGALPDGLFRIHLGQGDDDVIEQLGPQHGIPDGFALIHDREEGGPLVLRQDGVFRASVSGEPRFERATEFDEVLNFAAIDSYGLSTPRPGSVWVIAAGRVSEFIMEHGSLREITPAVLHLEDIPDAFVYVEGSGVVWVASQEGLLRYDARVAKGYETPYSAMIRTVWRDGQGALLFGGSGGAGFDPPTLRFAENHLRFEVAAPTFNHRAETSFQFWLEGFDRGWSEWSRERFKEYTNLPEGRYHFHVRARNAQGVLSEVDTFAFTVLPPWYRTWWAYLLYALAGVAVVWGYARWRLREHLLEMERERKVREEVERANARLVEANARLHEADKLKDDLLANTSHELRTPLTSILGFSSVLVDELMGHRREFAAHIHKSGQRLLRTVDALLDMARLQADTMELEPEELDLAEAIRDIARTFREETENKGLFLTVLPQDMAVEGRIDRSVLDCILTNVINNAVKFTESGGVTILIDRDDDNLYVTVRDSGIGMSEEFLPQLFAPFKQASDGYGRTHEGTGVGLAITYRYVSLLGGDIAVDSKPGRGTVFHLRLPRRAAIGRQTAAAPTCQRLEGARMLLVADHRHPHLPLSRSIGQISDLQVAVGMASAGELLQQDHYDVVLISELLIDEDPAGVLSAVRSLAPADETAIVAVSSGLQANQRDHFVKLGFDEHISAPFTRSRLLIKLEPLLATRPAVHSGVIG